MDSESRARFLDLLKAEVDLVRYFRVANGGFWPHIPIRPGVYLPADVGDFVWVVEGVAEFGAFSRNRAEERAITSPGLPSRRGIR